MWLCPFPAHPTRLHSLSDAMMVHVVHLCLVWLTACSAFAVHSYLFVWNINELSLRTNELLKAQWFWGSAAPKGSQPLRFLHYSFHHLKVGGKHAPLRENHSPSMEQVGLIFVTVVILFCIEWIHSMVVWGYYPLHTSLGVGTTCCTSEEMLIGLNGEWYEK